MRGLVRRGLMLALALGLLTAWTHHGRGPAAPRIGLSLSGDWYDRSELNPAATGLALSRAGAVVRNLEPGDLPRLDALLDGLDGLVLVGGMDDVDPALYGGDGTKARFVQRRRDDFEIELLRRAERRGLPVLAICRGAQLLAVAYGGTLKRLDAEPGGPRGPAGARVADGIGLRPGRLPGEFDALSGDRDARSAPEGGGPCRRRPHRGGGTSGRALRGRPPMASRMGALRG